MALELAINKMEDEFAFNQLDNVTNLRSRVEAVTINDQSLTDTLVFLSQNPNPHSFTSHILVNTVVYLEVNNPRVMVN